MLLLVFDVGVGSPLTCRVNTFSFVRLFFSQTQGDAMSSVFRTDVSLGVFFLGNVKRLEDA
jgi:hypothetical protein